MTTEESEAVVRSLIEEFWNQGNAAVLDEIFADDVLTCDDKVAWRWTFHGTHSGQLMGMPATGKRVTLTGITIDRIAGGRIAERWSQVDMLGLLTQLRADPAPGNAVAQVSRQGSFEPPPEL